MPSVSGKQHRFFEMIAHNPAAARAHGISPSVGEDFVQADQAAGLHFQSSPETPKARAKRIAVLLSARSKDQGW